MNTMTTKEVREFLCRVMINRKSMKYNGKNIGIGINRIDTIDDNGNRETILLLNDITSLTCSNTNLTLITDNGDFSIDLEVAA